MTRLFACSWLVILAFASSVQSQGYNFQLKVDSVGALHKIYFGYWYGGQALLLDSSHISQEINTVQFKGARKIPGGQYFFAGDHSKNTLDFIVNGEFDLAFSTTSATAWGDRFEVKKSKENTPYLAWKRYKNEQEARVNTARTMLDMLQRATKDRTVLEEKSRALRRLREETDSVARQQMIKYPELLFAKIVKAETPPFIPVSISPLGKDGRVNPAYMQYFRAHFWDSYDFTDERLLYTPVLARKTDDWMQLQPSNLDSVKVQMDFAFQKAAVHTKSRQVLLRLFLDRLDKPSFGGNESMLVHLFDKYYPSATAAGIDTAAWMRLEYKANAYRPTLPGAIAPPIILQDTTGNLVALHDFKAKYTLLYFFNPICSHCIEMTPKVYQMTLPYAAKGVRVFAVSTETDLVTWKNYVAQNTPNWACVAEFTRPSELEKVYATHTLPNLLLLDENKKVMIRRLPISELSGVLEIITR